MSEKLRGNYTNSGKFGGEVTTTRDDANDKTGLDTNLIGGSAAAGGQKGPAKIITVSVDDTTPVNIKDALITAGLTTYNAIGIQNRSGVEVEMNYAATWTYGEGWVVDDGAVEFRDITSDLDIYLLSQTGTVDIKVEGIGNSLS